MVIVHGGGLESSPGYLGAVGPMSVDREALKVWLEASCLAQGVPVVVTDAGVVAQLGVLMRGRDAAGAPRSGDRSPPALTAAKLQ